MLIMKVSSLKLIYEKKWLLSYSYNSRKNNIGARL